MSATGTQSQCTGTTQGDGMGREMGEGFGMRDNTIKIEEKNWIVFLLLSCRSSLYILGLNSVCDLQIYSGY